MAHAILELDSIPRSKELLNATIILARRRVRRRNLSQFAAANMAFWALFVLLVWPHMQALGAAPVAQLHTVYLPVVMR